MKTHLAVKGTVSDPTANRSLCGRSSGYVWNCETIENGQNIGGEQQVTCKFCLRIMSSRSKLQAA